MAVAATLVAVGVAFKPAAANDAANDLAFTAIVAEDGTVLEGSGPGWVRLAQAQGPQLPDATYSIQLSDKVVVKIGGATQNMKSNELKAGGKMGEHTLTADEQKQLDSQLPKAIHLRADPRGFKGKHKLYVKVDGQDRPSGLYVEGNREIVFGKLEATPGSGKQCGGIKGVKIHAYFNQDLTKIDRGTIQQGFIAGCAPVLVKADVFYEFTGQKM
ncbi:MAG: hypothetical protein KC466_08210 [Myxococcales bacterium]|nr:hypothetical protein [Myxococcales bacterium]